MRRYIPPKCDYTIHNNGILTDGSVHGKVTGTMMGGILGCSPFQTPFRVACDILGLCREDISDKPAVKAGQMLESKIISYLDGRYCDHGIFMPAEQIFEAREGDHDQWPSDFDDPLFAGHLDGMVMSPTGENFVLEIKTTANLRSWEDGVPEYYWWQVALYNRFTVKQKRAYVAVAMLTQEEQAHPEDWTPNDDNVVLYMPEIDPEKVARGIDEVIDWYHTYIDNDRTPQMDPKDPRDADMYAYLLSLTNSKDAMASLLDTYGVLEKEVKIAHAMIKDKEVALDDMKARLKEWMDIHGVDTIASLDGRYEATLTSTVKKSIDPKLLEKDGIDPTPYTVEKPVQTFRLKQI